LTDHIYFDVFDLRPKYPVKVHVWGGISHQGRTGICILEGRMDAPLYTDILNEALIPFIEKKMPMGHRLMQDNDPKHTSRHAIAFFEDKGINWWKTPPEPPDLNPIENLWHELKEFIRRVVKPKRKEELVKGIRRFRKTVDVEKCRKYIGHLQKVIPLVIERDGNATGF
jgi:transposase